MILNLKDDGKLSVIHLKILSRILADKANKLLVIS